MIVDWINGGFEFMAGILLWINVARLVKDKQVKGVYIPATVLFTLWGIWNLWYYPALNQIMSFLGGLIVVSANTTWVLLAIKYGRKK